MSQTRTSVALAGVAEDQPLLNVEGLVITATSGDDSVTLVEDVSLQVGPRETLGIVGESGSGKTVTALAVGRLLPPGLRIAGGCVRFGGRDLASASAEEMRALRGSEIGFVFQDPQNSLDPVFNIGNQLIEAIRAHQRISRSDARTRATELLHRVGIASPEKRMGDYPHQFSGGMAQRVMLAIALCCNPQLLIADEPTTSLDVTMQAQILDLIQSLQDELGLSVLLISHDLGVVAKMADRVAVMYAGQIVEQGVATDLFSRPRHPYLDALIGAQPEENAGAQRLVTIPGRVPPATRMPVGCRFHPRCSYAEDRCRTGQVPLEEFGSNGHEVRCVRSHELELAGVGRKPGAAPDAASVGAALTEAPENPVATSEQAAVVASGAGTEETEPALAVQPAPVPLVVATAATADGRGADEAVTGSAALLEVRDLSKEFIVRRGFFGRGRFSLLAVDNVSFDIRAGETLGLVGETGAGKSTVGRLVLGLETPTRGTVNFRGLPLGDLGKRPQSVHRDLQVIFQNPYASLNPSMTVLDLVAEPIDVHGHLARKQRTDAVIELLASVGLGTDYLRRYIYEMSGGQLQRVAIARALSMNPKLIVLDEPISSLDVSTQAQVINLLEDLRASHGLSYLLIGHNLAVVSHISDRLAILYAGQIVEIGDSAQVYNQPCHPYTQSLIGAILSTDAAQQRTEGAASNARDASQPGPHGAPSPGTALAQAPDRTGCVYAGLCPLAEAICTQEPPPEVHCQDGRTVRCHFVDEGTPLAAPVVRKTTEPAAP